MSRAVVLRRTIHRRLAILVLFAIGGLLLPAPALASNAITKYFAGPIKANVHCDPNAGDPDVKDAKMQTGAALRSDFCIAFYINGGDPATGDDMKRSVASTPQGFMATADTSPQCTEAQLNQASGNASTCPAASQIGTGEAILRAKYLGLVINERVDAKVWNMAHSPDEVASIAIEMAPELAGLPLARVKIRGRSVLRPQPDVGLQTILEGMPTTADLGALGKAPIAIDGFFMRLWGSKTDHPSMPQSFGMMGSDCVHPQSSTMRAESISGAVSEVKSAPYFLTDCEDVPFGVHADVTTSEHRPDVNTASTITLNVDQQFEPRVTGNMTSTRLTLPPGLEFAAQIASGEGGLPLCAASEFRLTNPSASSCPPGSKIGDVEIISPLQTNKFDGAAYLGEQSTPGELPDMYIEAGFGSKPDSPRVKIVGTMSVDRVTGAVTSTLTHLPQVMFKQFKLSFRGGAHSTLVTPRQCGTTKGLLSASPSATLTSATDTEGVPFTSDIPLTIDQDCVDPNKFEPTMSVSSSSSQAGASGVTTVTTTRPDRQARLTRVVANLPQGVLSNLNDVTECTLAQAAATACPDSSQIGNVTSQAGVGPEPYTVRGKVYLSTRGEGAVAGVVISQPVVFGSVNLGTLNLPARIELREGDLGLRFISDIPTRYKGLPLDLRSFTVALDRPGFGVNPTSCNLLSTNSTLTSDTGATAIVPTSLQMTGCDKLAFDPQLALTLTGKTGYNDHPALNVRLSLPAGGSNMASTKVTLPPGLSADLDQVKRACTEAAWNAGTCGADAVIGKVTARLAITPEIVNGTVSMIVVPGQTLPGVGMQLDGRFASRIRGQISIDKTTQQLVTSFPSLPDVPISVLDLNFEGGPRGALATTNELCAAPTIVMKGSFAAQSGASAERTATTSCVGGSTSIASKVKVTGSAKTKLKLTITAPAGKKIRSFVLGLPSGVALKRSMVSKGKVKGSKAIRVRGKRTLDLTIPKAGSSKISVTLPKGLLVVSKKVRKQKSFTANARLRYTDGIRAVLKLKLKP